MLTEQGIRFSRNGAAAIKSEWAEVHERISHAERLTLTTHVNPDGDGVGSQLAMFEHLQELGKNCRILNLSPLPDNLQFLDPENRVEVYSPRLHQEWLEETDLLLAFDVGDFRRLKNLWENAHSADVPMVSVDHHPSKSRSDEDSTVPWTLEIIDTGTCATGYLVWEYLKIFRTEPLTMSMARALYTALITDTGSFRYNNTDLGAHEMAIDLLQVGVRPYDIHKEIYEEREHSQARLFAAAVGEMQFSPDGRLVWCIITRQMLTETGARPQQLDGFCEFLRGLKGVEVAFLLLEVDSSHTKLNFRSKGRIPINDLAQRFGGGGHPFASGAFVDKNYRDLVGEVFDSVSGRLETFQETSVVDGSHGR